MKLGNDYIELMVDDSYITAIFYGDDSGLSADGSAAVASFMEDYTLDRGCFENPSDELDSGTCDVSGYWSDSLVNLKFFLYE